MPAPSVAWSVASRLAEYAGELRANVLRVVGVALFYVIEVVNFHGLRLGPIDLPKVDGVDARFHAMITSLCVLWVLTASGVILALRSRIFPPGLKYLTTAVDVVVLTSILLVADGAKSPIVVGYFLLIALSGLRLSAPLVRFSTVVTMLGYLVVCGDAMIRREALRVPRYHQLIMFLALGLTGVVLGQIVRRFRDVAEDFAARARTDGDA
jgi:hypothetical protein